MESCAPCDAMIVWTVGTIAIVADVGGCVLGLMLSNTYFKNIAAGDAVVSGICLLLATPFVFLTIYFAPSEYVLLRVLIFVITCWWDMASIYTDSTEWCTNLSKNANCEECCYDTIT